MTFTSRLMCKWSIYYSTHSSAAAVATGRGEWREEDFGLTALQVNPECYEFLVAIGCKMAGSLANAATRLRPCKRYCSGLQLQGFHCVALAFFPGA